MLSFLKGMSFSSGNFRGYHLTNFIHSISSNEIFSVFNIILMDATLTSLRILISIFIDVSSSCTVSVSLAFCFTILVFSEMSTDLSLLIYI